MKVPIITVWIEVGDSRSILDSGEQSLALLCSELLSRGRDGMGGWRSVSGDRSCPSTAAVS